MNYPTIILLRHGQTEWNLKSRYQGRGDSSLTIKGKKESKENAKKLKRYIESFDNIQIYSSPIGRAKESAYIVCEEIGVKKEEIIFDDLLKEFSYGIFEGRTKEECKEIYPDIFRQREENKWLYKIEGGESYVDVTKRLKRWLKNIDSKKTVVIMAHEMINRTLRGICRDLDIDEILKLRQSNNTVFLLKNGAEILLT